VDDEFIPVFEPNANYPQFAQRRGVEGYAVIELTISKEGSATDVVLIEESPESWGFGEETLKAGARLLYAPRFVNGEALEVPGVLYKYSFKMAN
jgi:protein TonB